MSRQYIAGIDVGTQLVKVIIADPKERNDKGFPKIIGMGQAESRGVRHGYVTNINDVSTSIRKAVDIAEKKSGIKVKKAFLGAGGIGLTSIIVTSSIITSRADQEITALDIKKIKDQCEKDIPPSAIINKRIIYDIPLGYKIDGSSVFGSPEGMKGNKLELKTLFIVCLDRHVSDLIQATNEADIKVEDVMASPVAAGFVTLSKSQKIAGCILANIGAETVSIAVFENELPTSLEVFPIGSTDITNDIALGLKVPLEEAEQIKIGAITGSSFPRKKLEEIIAARLSDVFELIENHLKKIGRNGLLPAGIVITGGGSSLNSIDALARASLKLPSRIGSIGIADNRQSFKDASWAVAYGLCIWGIYTEETTEISNFDSLAKKVISNTKSWLKQFLP